MITPHYLEPHPRYEGDAGLASIFLMHAEGVKIRRQLCPSCMIETIHFVDDKLAVCQICAHTEIVNRT